MASNEENPSKARSGSQECELTLTINDINVDPANVLYLAVREWMFDDSKVPRLELIIGDDGLFTDKEITYRGKIIKITLSRDKTDEYNVGSGSLIDTDFVILDFNFVKALGSNPGIMSEIHISALLNIPKLFEQLPNTSYENITSADAITNVLNEIGVDSQVSISVSDSMNWLRLYQTPTQFIQHVLSRSFESGDNNTGVFWFDIDKIGHYASITDMINNDEVKVAKYNIRYSTYVTLEELKTNAILDGYSETEALNTIWYTSLHIINNEGTNMTTGGSDLIESHLLLDDGTYKFGSGNSNEESPITLSEPINYNAFESLLMGELNPNNIFKGTENAIYSGTYLTGEIDNLHSDSYIIAPFKRTIAIRAIYNNMITMEMSPNTSTVLGDKINVKVHSNINTSDDNDYVNASLSGEYIITGALYLMVDGFFKKILTLNRCGFNKTDLGE